jgi:hypothetical protein
VLEANVPRVGPAPWQRLDGAAAEVPRVALQLSPQKATAEGVFEATLLAASRWVAEMSKNRLSTVATNATPHRETSRRIQVRRRNVHPRFARARHTDCIDISAPGTAQCSYALDYCAHCDPVAGCQSH